MASLVKVDGNFEVKKFPFVATVSTDNSPLIYFYTSISSQAINNENVFQAKAGLQ
jgi:hypothetical protein